MARALFKPRWNNKIFLAICEKIKEKTIFNCDGIWYLSTYKKIMNHVSTFSLHNSYRISYYYIIQVNEISMFNADLVLFLILYFISNSLRSSLKSLRTSLVWFTRVCRAESSVVGVLGYITSSIGGGLVGWLVGFCRCLFSWFRS